MSGEKPSSLEALEALEALNLNLGYALPNNFHTIL